MQKPTILDISILTFLAWALFWPSVIRADSAENIIRQLNDHWQQTVIPDEDCGWQNSVYHRGNLAAYHLTGETRYLDAATDFADYTCRWMLEGSSQNAEPDAQAAGSVFLDIYRLKSTAAGITGDLFDSLHRRIDAPVEPPDWIQAGVSAAGNSPDGVPEWTFQDWFYMAGPVFARAGSACDSMNPPSPCRHVTYDDNPYWNTLFALYTHMADDRFVNRISQELPGQGLLFKVAESGCEGSAFFDENDVLVWHDMNKKGDCSRIWSRGVGWVAAAYVDVLDSMTDDSYTGWIETDPIALHQLTATANRWQPGYVAQNAVDRDASTRWACRNLPGEADCELVVVLEEELNVEHVYIDFYRGEYRQANIDIYTTEDEVCAVDPAAADWFRRNNDQWSSGRSIGLETFPIWGAASRCVKVVGHGNSENDWNSFEEVAIAGSTELDLHHYQVNQRLREDFRNLASALIKLQREDGFWNPALMDAVTSSTTPSEGIESSGTALITYALAKGVRLGLLDRETYVPVILRAWDGLQARALRPAGEDGLELTFVQAVAQQPPDMPVTADDAVNADNPDRRYALGAMLLAAAEVGDLARVPLNDAVTPASQEGYPAMNTIDGDLRTRWAAEGTGPDFGWVGYRLDGLVENIDRIDVAWYRGDERFNYFDLQYSADTGCLQKYSLELDPIPGATGLTSSGTTLQMETFRFPPIAARCIGYQGRGNSENTWNSITEFAAYAPILPLDSSGPLSIDPDHVAANRWQEPNVPANVVDGDFSTSRWACNNQAGLEDCRIWVDIGEVRKISQVEIHFYNYQRYEYFDVETSTYAQCFNEADSIAWNSWGDTITGGLREVHTLGFGGQEVRCLRITGRGNHENSWNSIYELSFYAMPGDRDPVRAEPAIVSSSDFSQWPNVAENTLDQDLETRWSCFGIAPAGDPASCQVTYDLGAVEQLADVRIAWYRGDVRDARFLLDYSNDGEYWIRLTGGEVSAGTVEAQSVLTDVVQARYLRLTGQGNSENDLECSHRV